MEPVLYSRKAGEFLRGVVFFGRSVFVCLRGVRSTQTRYTRRDGAHELETFGVDTYCARKGNGAPTPALPKGRKRTARDPEQKK